MIIILPCTSRALCGLVQALPNGLSSAWCLYIVRVDASYVESFSDGSSPDTDCAIVMNSYDFIRTLTLTSEFREFSTSAFHHGVSHLIFVGNALGILSAVIPLHFVLSTGLYHGPVSLEFQGQDHVTTKHELCWGCT